MKYLTLKFDENNKPLIEGNFEFQISDDKSDISLVPKKKISFLWNPEMEQNIEAFKDNQYNEMYEAIGEKLKKDFIKLIKNAK